MAVRLILVRHGPTDFNDEDRLRGWMDPPLNAHGMQAASEMALSLHPQLKELPLYSSDLLRATQTAEYIKEDFLERRELRPWNVGIYAGQPGKVVHPLLVEYSTYSNIEVPFGESFSCFLERYIGFLQSLKQDSVLVTHFRNCKVAQAWAAANYQGILLDVLHKDDVKPAQVLTLVRP
jgi:broad specificity phosphatase PhoE